MVEPTPTSGQRSRGLVATLLILVFAAGSWGAWRWHEDRAAQSAAARPAAPAPVPVQAALVEASDIPIYLMGLGSVQAFNTVTVSRVDGQILKIAFQEGQMVKEGDLLLQIDPRPFQAALDSRREESPGRGAAHQRPGGSRAHAPAHLPGLRVEAAVRHPAGVREA